ncbi:hypothetical protein D3C73_1570890 [compost metagenome]
MMSLPSPPLTVSAPGRVASLWPRMALARSFGSMLACGLPSVSNGIRSAGLMVLFRPIASTCDKPLSNRKLLLELLIVPPLFSVEEIS